MPYPNFPGKHAEDAFFSPMDYRRFLERRGVLASIPVPAGVILCYQSSLFDHAAQLGTPIAGRVTLNGETVLIHDESDQPPIAVTGRFGIGAPAAAMVMEEWIALGARRFISIGTAGGLATNLPVGAITVCMEAIRDEGISHHYLADGEPACSDPDLTNVFCAALTKRGVTPTLGSTWTIDAIFRETLAELRHYQARGVLTVEMEAAALCAVATTRGVALATGFSISDSLADLVWDPDFDAPHVLDGLISLFDAARETIATYGRPEVSLMADG